MEESLVDRGEFELDESYFGAKRIRDKRRRGVAGKTPIFGLLMMDWFLMDMITTECSIVIMDLPDGKAMLMVLNVSGVWQRWRLAKFYVL